MMAMFVVLVVRDQNATNAMELLVLNLISVYYTFQCYRAPHDKKKKDLNNIKRVRVRTKREDTARNEEGEHELDVNSMEDTRQQTEEVL